MSNLDKILVGYAEDYGWSKRTKINKPSDFTKQAKQAIQQLIDEIIGEDEEIHLQDSHKEKAPN